MWKSFITNKVPLEQNIDIEYLSAQFEMTGGSIKNAVLTALFLATGQKQKCSMTRLNKNCKSKVKFFYHMISENMKIYFDEIVEK